MKRRIWKNGRTLNRAARREKEQNMNYFKEFLKVTKHFFPHMLEWLDDVKDPRNQSYIGYEITFILLIRLLGSVMAVNSMRNLTAKFNNTYCIENIKWILNDHSIVELPHYDTINNLLDDLAPEELKALRHKMIVRLIQMKCFETSKFKKRWLVCIDGTQISFFRDRHCEHCLTKTYNKGKPDEYTLYFHYVLEAKLTVGDMVFSLGSEFIENPINLQDTDYYQNFDEKLKQDCELKAFYRLEQALKKEYPRLPMCLLLDSLYANQNVFEICKANGWSYIIRFKSGSLPTVAQEFEALSQYGDTFTVTQKGNRSCEYRYVNEIDYEGHKINLAECKETTIYPAENTAETKTFTYITSPELRITPKNRQEIIATGRKRWRIENYGFNEQKNHGYELTHTFSHHYTAMKNHYLLIQIAHILRQLYEVGIKMLKEFKKSLANIAYDLLLAFQTKILLPSDLEDINCRFQIRINDSLY